MFYEHSDLYDSMCQQHCCKRAYGLGSQCRPNECLFWVWETPGGRDLGRGGSRWARWAMQGLIYEQPKGEVDGSHHSKEGPSKWKRGTRGTRGARGILCINLSTSCIYRNECSNE